METLMKWFCLLIVAGVLVAGWCNHSPEMLVLGGIYATICTILLRLDMESRPDNGK